MDFTLILTIIAAVIAYYYVRGKPRGSRERKMRLLYAAIAGLMLILLYLFLN